MNCAKQQLTLPTFGEHHSSFRTAEFPRFESFWWVIRGRETVMCRNKAQSHCLSCYCWQGVQSIEVTICQYKFCGFVVLTSFSGIFQNINSCLVPTVVRNSSHSLPFMKQQNSLWSNTIALLLLLGTFVLHYRPTCFLTIPFTVASCERSVKNWKSSKNISEAQCHSKGYLILHCNLLRMSVQGWLLLSNRIDVSAEQKARKQM